MKKALIFGALAMVVIGMAGSAMAATTPAVQIAVSATVANNCSPISGGDLSFGTSVDPASATDTYATGNDSTISCSFNPTPYSVSAVSTNGGNGANGVLSGKLKAGGAADIPYTLFYKDTFSGAGIGNNIKIIDKIGDKAGKTGAYIAAGAAAGATAGVPYIDYVTLTVNY